MERFKLDYYTDDGENMILLSILVRYKNCFNQNKHTYKQVTIVSQNTLNRYGITSSTDCLEYLLNKFKEDRESSKLLRNIKRKNKKIK